MYAVIIHLIIYHREFAFSFFFSFTLLIINSQNAYGFFFRSYRSRSISLNASEVRSGLHDLSKKQYYVTFY